MDNTKRILDPKRQQDDYALRPESFQEFVGQTQIIENLNVFLEAAKIRGESLDHTLFSGPPGLGKTTLARIIAHRQGKNIYTVAAPNIRRPGDLVKVLTGLETGDVLFIDEIHRLSAPVEETLYSAMEDRQISISLAEGMAAQLIQLDLPSFTLVGATTKAGSLTAPLRDRFGIKLQLEYYSDKEIAQVVQRAAEKLQFPLEEGALTEISTRSRRTPRVAIRLLKRIQDFATVASQGRFAEPVSMTEVQKYFEQLEIDKLGLTRLDIRFMKAMKEQFKQHPVGLKPISAYLGEEIINLEEFIEPYLVQSGFIIRTPRGRVLTEKAEIYLGLKSSTEEQLFD